MLLKQTKNVLIVGGSSGVGLDCIRRLHATGRYRIYSASRTSNSELLELSTYIKTDITVDDSVNNMIQTVLEDCQQIHLLVHSAGQALAGPIEETSIEEAQRQFDSNFWGLVRVNKAVLPNMRESQSGTIINIGSLAGMMPLPFQAYYCASKFALEAFCEVLHHEVAPFGVRVHLIQPGDLNTTLTDKRQFASASGDNTPYSARFANCMERVRVLESNGQAADKVAQAVVKLAERNSSRLRYRVAKPGEQFAVALRRYGFLRTYNYLIRSVFGH